MAVEGKHEGSFGDADTGQCVCVRGGETYVILWIIKIKIKNMLWEWTEKCEMQIHTLI